MVIPMSEQYPRDEDGDVPLQDFAETLAAEDTPIADNELEDFRDHLSVVITLMHCRNRGTIRPQYPQADDTLAASFARMQAYLDAYNVEPELEENPVPRAVDVMQNKHQLGDCVAALSQEEWKKEGKMLELAYSGGPYYPIISEDDIDE